MRGKSYSRKSKINSDKAKVIASFLKRTYKEGSGLKFRTNFELVVAVVLSAQCTDNLVNKVTPKLFSLVTNFEELTKISTKKLESLIRKVNYFKTKAKNLKALAKRICDEYGGQVPLDFSNLICLPGIGRKTANVILAENGIASFPVDTHVQRVAKRLGLVEETAKINEVEQRLKKIFPEKDWIDLHHGFIWHGRLICKAKNPKCNDCKLSEVCCKVNVKNS